MTPGGLRRATVFAPATVAPLGSLTLPLRLPVVCCPKAVNANKHVKSIARSIDFIGGLL